MAFLCWETGLCIRLNLPINKCAIGHCKSKLKLGSSCAFTRPLNYTEQPQDINKSSLSSLSPAGWAVGWAACRHGPSVGGKAGVGEKAGHIYHSGCEERGKYLSWTLANINLDSAFICIHSCLVEKTWRDLRVLWQQQISWTSTV